MAAYKSAPIGALFDPSKGVGSTFGGDAELPRSIASDGRRWLLFSHVLVHILALAANIVSAVYFFGDFAQMQMKVGCIVAVSMHGLGILALLALAAAELKQLAYVFGMAVIFSFLLSALSATVGMAIFTFRSDDVLTEPCARPTLTPAYSKHAVLFDSKARTFAHVFAGTGFTTHLSTCRRSVWASSWPVL